MSDAVPAWAHEKAEVLPHDPRLADRARTERGRLARLLAPWLVDGLRRDDQLARSYEKLKRRLAAQHAGDREAYTDAKAEFVADALWQVSGPGTS
jgi:GrpB-like predicted nucleotidyltransferase (UPF0157 family)